MAKFTGPIRIIPNVNAYTDTPQVELGTVAEGANGTKYRYVRFVDSVAYAKGHVVTLASAGWNVTNDRVGGSDIGLVPVGVIHTDTGPAANQYGWVQISGIAQVLCSGTGIAAGDILVVDGTSDGAASEADYTAVAHGDFKTVGIALGTIANGATGDVMLTIGSA